MNLKKAVCVVRDHRWRVVVPTAGLKKGAPFCVCLRCGEIGWRV